MAVNQRVYRQMIPALSDPPYGSGYVQAGFNEVKLLIADVYNKVGASLKYFVFCMSQPPATFYKNRFDA